MVNPVLTRIRGQSGVLILVLGNAIVKLIECAQARSREKRMCRSWENVKAGNMFGIAMRPEMRYSLTEKCENCTMLSSWNSLWNLSPKSFSNSSRYRFRNSSWSELWSSRWITVTKVEQADSINSFGFSGRKLASNVGRVSALG
jgi:hypothetical protein